jgi:AGZA family xanthine/uracil permease-like MFS transporter
MLLAALLVYVIEARLLAAASCAALAAGLSWFGVMHGWRFTPADTVLQLGWGVGSSWALGYGVMTLVLLAAWLTCRCRTAKTPDRAPLR